ncbi:hypothetical protein K432DRAFT_69714 [Lepidopterella palustris CBS 459.81]|uniref:Uncharacterized protein n=1 Tax=Lepidopterella palustris CBS 459.81 TaxID=1314670 RepID=A0A8E2E8T8_9PEZI|nr:hypothetical protein K432DRAFT_69714 [Lepidopterella palustris CBS 459.81]
MFWAHDTKAGLCWMSGVWHSAFIMLWESFHGGFLDTRIMQERGRIMTVIAGLPLLTWMEEPKI